MRRRWVFAFGASFAVHALTAAIVAGQFQRQPIEIEIASTRLDEIHDFPLGPPPPAPSRKAPPPRAPPPRRASRPPTPEPEGEPIAARTSNTASPGIVDEPDAGLTAPPSASLAGLPGDFVDTYADRVRAVTPDHVNAAIAKHVHARDLEITMVSTASVVRKLLVQAKIKDTAIDVVSFERD